MPNCWKASVFQIFHFFPELNAFYVSQKSSPQIMFVHYIDQHLIEVEESISCRSRDSAGNRDKRIIKPVWNVAVVYFISRIIIKSTLRAEALRRKTGAPIDGFLQNTLETLFRLSRLEMHSKWCYNICICSVILGELKSFRNYKSLQGLQYYFPENVRCNLTFYESENFSDSSLHHILESENFRFPFHFSKKNCVTWVIKYEKLNFRKSQRIY